MALGLEKHLMKLSYDATNAGGPFVVVTPLTKLGELEKFAHHVCTHITSKRIELEGPGWSGLVRF